MKIAVIEHRMRNSAMEDANALAQSSRQAADAGAHVVFLPMVLPVEDDLANQEYARLLSGVPGTRLLPRIPEGTRSMVFAPTADIPLLGERLGTVALVFGDACMDESVLRELADQAPAVLVMSPRSENELQAEAALELAIGLSESVAGVVIVVEAVGAEPGDPGHGGSAVIAVGEVLAEAMGDGGDVLLVDIPEPAPRPEVREPVPPVPTILAQRLANHEGRHLDMGYPADLTDGPGPR